MTAPTNIAATSDRPPNRPSLRRAQAMRRTQEHAQPRVTFSRHEAGTAALGVAASRIAEACDPLRGGAPSPQRAAAKRLVAGRWSLVDTFEHGGKRYLVAEQNGAAVDAAPDLSPRERTVLAAAAAGHHNKLIAYDLGLADSTVRVLLFRAIRKLGVASRAEAITHFGATTRSR